VLSCHIFFSALDRVEVWVMGRTIPSWRMVVEAELEKLKRFRAFLRMEDKEVFDDLLDQCRLYASFAGSMASPLLQMFRRHVKSKSTPISLLMLGRNKELSDERIRMFWTPPIGKA
jgi:hypothetical protein